MKFRENLYIGEHIASKQMEMIANLQNNKFSPTLYVILLCEHQVEIVYNYLLFQKQYADKDYTVVGFALGKQEAFRMVERIVKDALAAGMETDIAGFLSPEENSKSDGIDCRADESKGAGV